MEEYVWTMRELLSSTEQLCWSQGQQYFTNRIPRWHPELLDNTPTGSGFVEYPFLYLAQPSGLDRLECNSAHEYLCNDEYVF
jgi:hypothetical protein